MERRIFFSPTALGSPVHEGMTLPNGTKVHRFSERIEIGVWSAWCFWCQPVRPKSSTHQNLATPIRRLRDVEPVALEQMLA